MRPSTPPRAALIGIGDGPLVSDTADQNCAEIGRVLGRCGLQVTRAVSVPGDAGAIALALAAVAEADLCLLVGGFGPGSDEVAMAALAGGGGPSAAELARAAPLQAPGLDHRGLALEVGGRPLLVLPDAPAAVRSLAAAVAAEVRRRWPDLPPRLRTYRVIGPDPAEARRIARAAIAAATAGGGEAIAPSIACDGPEVLVRLAATGGAAVDLTRLDEAMLTAYGAAIHGIGEADLATRVVRALSEHRLTIASAESCTGGRVAALVTAVPGASACLHGAIVAYDNAVKTRALGVPAALLSAWGAVSEPVARAMAAGVRRAFPGHADVGVGITGIAGPGGGSAAKPVGTVDFAVDDLEGSRHRRLHLAGDRPAIQRSAAIWALRLVWERLRERGLCAPALLD